MVKLNFKITFKKGIVGKCNNPHNNRLFLPDCTECGYDIKKGESYYYWGSIYGEACPIEDDDCYILCKKCANKRCG